GDHLAAISASGEVLQHVVTFISAQQVFGEGGKLIRFGMFSHLSPRNLQSLADEARNFGSLRHLEFPIYAVFLGTRKSAVLAEAKSSSRLLLVLRTQSLGHVHR